MHKNKKLLCFKGQFQKRENITVRIGENMSK